MSQHDYAIADAAGAAFLADLNLALPALASQNSGVTAPATTYAYMWWADTTSGWLKQRDAANAVWILRAPLGTGAAVDVASAATLDLTANTATSGTLRITGTTTTTAITLADGQTRLLRAAAAWPITHGASLICPGSASYTCAAGDLILAIGEAAGVVRLMIWKANGTAVVGSGITLGTAQVTTSGTTKDFAIPAGTKRITVMFSGVSTNGTSIPMLQLGDSGGIENTSYQATATGLAAGTLATADFTTGFGMRNDWNAGRLLNGSVVLNHMGSNVWVVCGGAQMEATTSGFIAGIKTLSAECTTIRLTTVGGSETFDAGSWNIATE